MPFPEFEPGKKKLLFFSRGRGRGHAIPDIEIVKQIEKLAPDIEARFVSYASGARTLQQFGFSIIDIGQPEDSSIADVTLLAGRLIGWLKPDLVVSHEEFAAMPIAKVFDRNTVFITDFFSDPNEYAMDALRFADEILFAGEPGVFEEPSYLAGKIKYVGPVIREFGYSVADRTRARRELRIPTDSFVVAVLPGSWSEARSPVFELVRAAFECIEIEPKRLCWVGGQDFEQLRQLLAADCNAIVTEWEPVIDRIMVASDIVITKANRATARELASLGVPAIAISHGHNPTDDRIVRSLPGTQFLYAAALSPETLREVILERYSKCGTAPLDDTTDRHPHAAIAIARTCASRCR